MDTKLLVLLAALALAAPALAVTRVVDLGGGGDFMTIQPAIDASASGDVIVVHAGTYTGSGNTGLNFGGRNLTLQASSGADVTVIDAEQSARLFVFASGETAAARVEGFTLTHGLSGSVGGAVYIQDASPTFVDCYLVENSSDAHGGAVYVQGGEPSFDGCTFVGNTTQGRGGALWIDGAAFVTIDQATITGNTANLSGLSHNGGGLVVSGDSHLQLTRSILWGNRAGDFDDLYVLGTSSAAISCCDVDSGGIGGAGGVDYGAGVVVSDPHFCQPAYCRASPWGDGDYGLAANSPCLPTNNACGERIGAWPQSCGEVVVWTGGAGTTAWENPNNWSTHNLPGPGDNVQITTGDVVLASTAEIGILTQCSESDDSDLTLTITTGGHLLLASGVTDKEVHVATVTSDKTVIENGGEASTGTNNVPQLWHLLGEFDLNNGHVNGALTLDGSGAANSSGNSSLGHDTSVINRGHTPNKVAGAPGLNVVSGTLTVDGTLKNHGDISIAGGAALQLGGTLDNLADGAIALEGSITGNGSLSNRGAMTKTGATASDVVPGVTNLRDAGGAGTIVVSENVWRVGGAFSNSGLVGIADGATLRRTGTITNAADGIIQLAGNIGGGGLLTNQGLVQRSGAGTSTVTGTIANTADLDTGDRGRLLVPTGALNLTTLRSDGIVDVSAGAALTVTSELISGDDARLSGGGSVDVVTASFTNTGRVRPGASPGTLTVVGDYPSTPSTRLFVELGGTAPGTQYDRLVATGTATLGGAMHVALINGFVPSVGDTFTVLTAASVLATFDCVSGLPVAPGLRLVPSVLSDRVLLVATAGDDGDQAPLAVRDDVIVSDSLPSTLSPLANDSDPDGDGLTLVSVIVAATAGTARVSVDGETITYWPPAASTALDSLVYVVTDCAGAVDSATVVLHLANTTATPDPPEPLPDAAYKLYPNTPNPFNPFTSIRFDVARPGPMRVAIYDLRGRLVQTLTDGFHAAGTYATSWLGQDALGQSVASGVYVARLEAPGRVVATRKLTLVR